ncbi:MAG: tRNA (adenosine(37)-N6)-threonylcarbamoyltransferase complex dimerization subunit type 1 TsaB [Planctomycetes bacterium]|nr:tRNA (adenosine(37)-N6)-threonylcarbamoyltransferase complex dimerization subunit type 1 TsaB [Planctomycetota bacterium]
MLGIETAGPLAGVALLQTGREPRVRTFEARRTLGAELAPAIQALLEEAGVAEEGPDLIAVDTGPGSYTGLRIGIAAAKGLAFAWRRPVVGINATVALRTWAPKDVPVVCALDASRGEVYAQLFPTQGNAPEPDLGTPDELGDAYANAWVVGDGAQLLVGHVPGARVLEPAIEWPTPLRIAELGAERYAKGSRDDSLSLIPTYFRATTAKSHERQRSMRSPKA